jgi:hypothetical protein
MGVRNHESPQIPPPSGASHAPGDWLPLSIAASRLGVEVRELRRWCAERNHE